VVIKPLKNFDELDKELKELLNALIAKALAIKQWDVKVKP